MTPTRNILLLTMLVMGNLKHLVALGREQSVVDLVKWRWVCVGDECVKVRKDRSEVKGLNEMSLEGCKSICGPYGSLWPRPKYVSLSKALLNVQIMPKFTETVIIKGASMQSPVADFLRNSWEIFLVHFKHEIRSQKKQGNKIQVEISINTPNVALNLDTDESYSVKSDETLIQIQAATIFGARHALETLSQLITYDEQYEVFQIPKTTEISDEPAFKYRGLLLDTGRNYFSLDSIRKILDGMSYDKLNVFHWHMNEHTSFPFVSKSVPNLTRHGAYSDKELYYPEDIKDIVSYARQRGIIVLPEFDGPGHASAGWEWGPDANLGELVVCNQKDWNGGMGQLSASPNSGQLNPLNENVYKLLKKLYDDFVTAFETENQSVTVFHMGGDEVFFSCWAMDSNIRSWMTKHNYPEFPDMSNEGYLALWSKFQNKAKDELTKVKPEVEKNLILWTSKLTSSETIERFVPKENYVIQIWCEGTDYWISDLLKKGYRMIFSNSDAWYLDCGFGAWIYSGSGPENNWCSPFKGWKTVYMNSPRSIVERQNLVWDDVKELVWGGEATMWSEQVDHRGGETRIFPRISAMAERLWSDPDSDWREAEARILEHRARQIKRGLRSDVVQPEFCRQNQGWCYMPQSFSPEFNLDIQRLPEGELNGSPDSSHNAELIDKLREKVRNQENELHQLHQQLHMRQSQSRNVYRRSEQKGSLYSYLLFMLVFLTAIWVLSKRHLVLGIIGTFRRYRDRMKNSRA